MTDRRAARGDLDAAVEAAVAAGVDLVQVRERELEARELLEHVRRLLEAARRGAAARGGSVRVVVNRRIDVALAAGADGVHLGFDAAPPEVARALLGPAAWVGVSCHSAEEVLTLDPALVDYAHLAPIFAPLSKPAERPALGLAELERARAAVPVLAQGGVTAANAAGCLRAGAAGLAVTGTVLLVASPAAATRELRKAMRSD